MRLAALFLATVLMAQQKPPQRVEWVQLRGYNYRTGRINAGKVTPRHRGRHDRLHGSV